MELHKKIEETLENNGFTFGKVHEQDGEYYIEIGQSTPLGEDWYETVWFDGTPEGFCQAITERYFNFDINDEASLWIPVCGKNGVPESVEDLLEDAKWKEKTLGTLGGYLSALEFEEKTFELE